MLRGQGRGVQRQTPLHRQQPHGRHRDGGRPAAQPSRQEALHPKHDGLDLGRGLVLRALREEGQLQAPHPLHVHVEAVVTRCENTSRLLDWDKYFVPILQDYMVRMAQDGYPEGYRRMV